MISGAASVSAMKPSLAPVTSGRGRLRQRRRTGAAARAAASRAAVAAACLQEVAAGGAELRLGIDPFRHRLSPVGARSGRLRRRLRVIRNKKAAGQAAASVRSGSRVPDRQLCLWRPPLDAEFVGPSVGLRDLKHEPCQFRLYVGNSSMKSMIAVDRKRRHGIAALNDAVNVHRCNAHKYCAVHNLPMN